ncbi:hypothetical protein V8E54_007694 [Elaphomyces granulatus]
MSMIRSLVASVLLTGVVSAKTIDVTVGNGAILAYHPSNITADESHRQPGFIRKSLCSFSGFIPTASGVAPTQFVITVKDTSPIWFYCGQADHCQKGMVGVINEPMTGNKTLKAFASAAKNVSKSENQADVMHPVWDLRGRLNFWLVAGVVLHFYPVQDSYWRRIFSDSVPKELHRCGGFVRNCYNILDWVLLG